MEEVTLEKHHPVAWNVELNAIGQSVCLFLGNARDASTTGDYC